MSEWSTKKDGLRMQRIGGLNFSNFSGIEILLAEHEEDDK